MSHANELAERLRQWRRDGWTTAKTASGGWKLTRPGLTKSIYIAATPSDLRAFANIDADIKRAMRQIQPVVVQSAKTKPIQLPTRNSRRAKYPPLVLRAWAYTICRLRACGRDWSIIQGTKQRLRSDRIFRAHLLDAYQRGQAAREAPMRAKLRGRISALEMDQAISTALARSSARVADREARRAEVTEAARALLAEAWGKMADTVGLGEPVVYAQWVQEGDVPKFVALLVAGGAAPPSPDGRTAV